MTNTPRKPTLAQARKAALQSDYAPLYAVAGLTQAVATTLQASWHDAGEKATKQLADWQSSREQQAKAAADELTTLVKGLPVQVKALPETTKARLAELQKQAQEMVRGANAAYGQLAGRGKLAVDRTVGTARQVTDAAESRPATRKPTTNKTTSKATSKTANPTAKRTAKRTAKKTAARVAQTD